MQIFKRTEIREALDFAKEGGQALHLFSGSPSKDVPGCFKRSSMWAHLIDQDKNRLKQTARDLGITRIVIHREDKDEQHVDLRGRPLIEAVEMCKDEEES